MLPPLQIVLLSLTCLSMCIYILIIAMVIINRKRISALRNSFFLLVLSYFVADFIFFVEFTIFFRFRKYGLLNFFITEGGFLFNFLPVFSNGLHYYIKIVVYIGQILFAANRLTSAVFVLNYERHWSFNRIVFLCILQFTLPLLAVLPMSPWINSAFWTKYIFYPEQQTLRLETDPDATGITAYIDGGCSVGATIACLIMYTITLLKLRDHQKRREKSLTSTELRLLFSALITFAVLVVNTVVQVLTIIADMADVEGVMFVHDLSYPVVDAMYSVQPWALLLTSSVIRQRLKYLILGRRSDEVTELHTRITASSLNRSSTMMW